MKAYEQGTGAYFATPPVNLIYAFNASLTTITKSPEISLEERFKLHQEASQRIKSSAEGLGLKQVSDPENAANGMTAVSPTFSSIYEITDSPLYVQLYFPKGYTASDIIPRLSAKGVVVAGGLHKDIKDHYFRIGCEPCFLFLVTLRSYAFFISGIWGFPLFSNREVISIRSSTAFGIL